MHARGPDESSHGCWGGEGGRGGRALAEIERARLVQRMESLIVSLLIAVLSLMLMMLQVRVRLWSVLSRPSVGRNSVTDR